MLKQKLYHCGYPTNVSNLDEIDRTGRTDFVLYSEMSLAKVDKNSPDQVLIIKLPNTKAKAK
jgi:hypothetical protein